MDWRWNEVRDVQRLAGRTLGLIGFGRIGQAVCRRARAFGLEVLASDPRIDEQTARRHEARLCDVDELLAASHVVSLHCNLHPGNLGLLNRDAFARMRLKPLLINVARGGLIVEADLVRALDDGQVSGAALDVLAQDSPDLGRHPLAGRADVLLTPHVAFYSEAALADLRRISAQNIGAYLQGTARRRVSPRVRGGGRAMSANITFDGAPESGVIDFGVGQPSADLLPLRRVRAASERFFAHAQPIELNYGEKPGDSRFRTALAEFLTRAGGHAATADSLFLTAGTSQALDFVCQRFTRPGDTVFVEEPSYFLAFQIFRDHGLEIVGIPLDGFGHGRRCARARSRTPPAEARVHDPELQ